MIKMFELKEDTNEKENESKEKNDYN